MKIKRHALDRLVDAIRWVGRIYYLRAGIYESAQKQFKEKYVKNSKQTHCAMSEAVKRVSVNLQFAQEILSEHQQNKNIQRLLHLWNKNLLGIRFLPNNIERAQKYLKFRLLSLTTTLTCIDGFPPMISLAQRISENGLAALLRLLKELFTEYNAIISDVRSQLIEKPYSVFVSTKSAPFMCSEWRSFNWKAKEKRCHFKGMVASEPFKSSRKRRFDCAMVLSDSNDGKETIESGDHEGSSSRFLWLDRALSFYRILVFRNTNRLHSGCKKFTFVEHDTKVFYQALFSQWFNVLDDDELPIEKSNETLKCVIFFCGRGPHETNTIWNCAFLD